MKRKIKEISVLIVDDNLVNRQVMSFNMQRYGIIPDHAENGKIAFEKYCQQPYDLVLMDIMMPVMNGLDSTKSIRNFEHLNGFPRALIIAISANFMDENKEEYISYGLDYILKKPINFKEFDELLKKYFEI